MFLKFLVPALMATVGVGAAVAGVTHDSTSNDGRAQVWIDSPFTSSTIAPGPIKVSVHATANADIKGIKLTVDNKEVATSSELEKNGLLVFTTLNWQAANGEHVLVATQIGGSGHSSDETYVTVSENAPTTTAPATTSPTTTTTPGGSTTTTTSSTTTTTTPGDTSSTAPPVGGGTPPATTGGARPFIGAVDASTNNGGLAFSDCGWVFVDAVVTGATSVRMSIAGQNQDLHEVGPRMPNHWIGEISSPIPPVAEGTYDVVITARNANGTTTKVAGRTQIRRLCPS